MEELVDRYIDFGEIDELDGITVDCFDSQGWWCNVRKSNTEPLLRLNLEAKTQAKLDEMLGEIAPMLARMRMRVYALRIAFT